MFFILRFSSNLCGYDLTSKTHLKTSSACLSDVFPSTLYTNNSEVILSVIKWCCAPEQVLACRWVGYVEVLEPRTIEFLSMDSEDEKSKQCCLICTNMYFMHTVQKYASKLTKSNPNFLNSLVLWLKNKTQNMSLVFVTLWKIESMTTLPSMMYDIFWMKQHI